jgi:hypothetical protein
MNARKYILVCNEVLPSGVTTVTATTVFSLLSGFGGIRPDNVQFDYPQITVNDLSLLTNSQYSQRLSDFLIANNIDNQTDIVFLTNTSVVDEPSCDAPATTTSTTTTTFNPSTTNPTTTTTTTTTLPTIQFAIVLGFDVTTNNSTISFDLSGETVTFTGVTSGATGNEFDVDANGTTTANNFATAVQQYLNDNGLDSIYVVSTTNSNVEIFTTDGDPIYSFGSVNITNAVNIGESENSTLQASAPVTDDKTYFLPGNETDSGDTYNIIADGIIFVVDFFAGNLADNLEILIDDATTATTHMDTTNLDAVSTNFGNPNIGDFRAKSLDGTRNPDPNRNNNSDFYIGDQNGVIPDRLTEFYSDTGLQIGSLPLADDLVLPNTNVVTAQQRIWVKDVQMTDDLRVEVTGAIQGGTSNTGWALKTYQILPEEGNITLINQT